MHLDLIQDQQKLRRFLAKRIKDYPVYENIGPGRDDAPVSNVVFGFSFHEGWASVIFDTRRGGPIDGEWTAHLERGLTYLDFLSWRRAFRHLHDGKRIEMTSRDGKGFVDPKFGIDLSKQIGEMIIDVMDDFRDNPPAGIPFTRSAFMYLQEFDSQFEWPGQSEADFRKYGRLDRVRRNRSKS